MAPPTAAKQETRRVLHGDEVVDEYAWIRDPSDPATRELLEAENSYARWATSHLSDLRSTIYDEIEARSQADDRTVPARRGQWWYYSRTPSSQSLPVHCRLPCGAPDEGPPVAAQIAGADAEQVMLDENLEVSPGGYLALGALAISPDGRLLAFSTDLTGDERYTLRCRDLASGEDVGPAIPQVLSRVAWSPDSSCVYYLTTGSGWRPRFVWRHRLGSDPGTDEVVYEEPDERFWLDVSATKTGEYVMIESVSKLTSEIRVIDGQNLSDPPRVIAPRRTGVRYLVEHWRDKFFIAHNDQDHDGGPNFAVSCTSVTSPSPQYWSTVIPHDDAARILHLEVFAQHLVVYGRKQGLTALTVGTIEDDGGLTAVHDVPTPANIYSVEPVDNPEFQTDQLRFSCQSLTIPESIYDYDMTTRELKLRKSTPVHGYEIDALVEQREWALAEDGTEIPISVVYHRDTPRDGSAGLLLYGYGCYGMSTDPFFSVPRLSLLDRGMVWAIAHVRGGGEMGKRWHEAGRLTSKINTFTDYVTCARYLIDIGWTSADRLIGQGGSAGGMLMGWVANHAPEVFRGLVLHVPFVDVLNTILDTSLPLTTTEWEEWGEPATDREAYQLIKSYSPYENVAQVPHPAILAVSSVNDARVSFVEATKWVSRLRDRTVDSREILLRTDMGGGHHGPSNRDANWQEYAYYYAWLLDLVAASNPACAVPELAHGF